MDVNKKGGVRLIVNGHGHGEFAAPCIRKFQEVFRGGLKLTIYVDFWDMDAYESQFRTEMQNWGSSHRSGLEQMHIAQQSKLVAMGISVANLAMGVNMKVYTKKAEFDRECQRALMPLGPALLNLPE
ncbi:MAG: hypothetical protein IPK82_19360 [Polyangiaceae bacterium]|nr:hypothetical protein [Polyangiaceae bacterium]